MVGGVMVERNVKEAKIALRNRIDKEINPDLKKFTE